MKYRDLILDIKKRPFEELRAHKKEVTGGMNPFLYFFSDHNNNPHGKIFVASRTLENIQDAEPHVIPHTHTVDQMYMWIGSQSDMNGLDVEIFLDGESYNISSPCAVYIPAGLKHAHRYISGSGYFIGILLTDGRSYNEVTN